MDLENQLRKNQKHIISLAARLDLLKGTPHAQKPEVRAKIIEMQDRTLHKLQELELAGQQAKITSMEKAIALLKSGL